MPSQQRTRIARPAVAATAFGLAAFAVTGCRADVGTKAVSGSATSGSAGQAKQLDHAALLSIDDV